MDSVRTIDRKGIQMQVSIRARALVGAATAVCALGAPAASRPILPIGEAGCERRDHPEPDHRRPSQRHAAEHACVGFTDAVDDELRQPAECRAEFARHEHDRYALRH
jgi:hypothetical protein